MPFVDVEPLTRELQAAEAAQTSATEPYTGPDPGGASEEELIFANEVVEGGPFAAALAERITAIVESGSRMGEKLEKLLLADASVEERYASADELAKILKSDVWVPRR